MPFTGPQVQQIANALCDAYTRDELKRVLRTCMDEDFDRRVADKAYDAQVFELVTWAERQGRGLELLHCAYANNSGNPALQALWAALGPASPPPLQEAYDVFLSYSHHDTEFARRLRADLEQAGITVWTDEGLAPGTPNWQEDIEAAVERSLCLVVVMTPSAKASKWVRIEVDLAQELGHPVLPMLAAGERREAVLLSLRDVQYVDARGDYAAAVQEQLMPVVWRLSHRDGRGSPPTSGAPSPSIVVPQISPLATELNIEWITIPAGEFWMGSDPKKDDAALSYEQPQHRLFLPEYRIAKYPITNAQYAVFVEATRRAVKGNWAGGKPPKGREHHPVVFSSWHDAVAFCVWASQKSGMAIRLPSEAEWEKAARGEDGRLWPWGSEPPTRKLCNFGNNQKGTTSVDKYPHGASPYGVMDMAGNVWEWTRSLWGKEIVKPAFRYPYDPQDGREAEGAPDDLYRVLRGGSYYLQAGYARCASRFPGFPDDRSDPNGFRVVASPSTSVL